MSGYVNKVAGLAIFWFSVAGMATVALWWRWPLSRAEVLASFGSASFIALLALLIRRMRTPRYRGDDIPWRETDTLLRRYNELAVKFDDPPPGDLGVYRPAQDWNEKYRRFVSALSQLEAAALRAPLPQYDEYQEACSAIRDILSGPSQEPEGKHRYLSLGHSKVMERVERLADRDRPLDRAS